MKCIECQRPARFTRALDAYDSHCSNECAIASWDRAVALGSVVCVGEMTVAKIDEQLSTTGFPEVALIGVLEGTTS